MLGKLDFMKLPWIPGKAYDCYIGQSIRLGIRIKQHAKGFDSNTHKFLEQLGTNATVYLYIVTDDMKKKLASIQPEIMNKDYL